MRSLRVLLPLAGVLLQGPLGVTASPASDAYVESNDKFPFSDFENDHDPLLQGRADSLMSLRIMPLGASIVNGVGSDPDHNGFRGPLRQALRFNGFPVDMVGSVQIGTMDDNDNEGTPGALINETLGHFDRSKDFKPNVIVLNVGTNDANRVVNPVHTATSPPGSEDGKQRMSDLLSHIWSQTDMANSCIMLSTLIPSGVANGIKWNPTFNAFYRELVDELKDEHCIYLADMDPPSGPAQNWIGPDDRISDGIHPNLEGHRKMAYVFWQTILQAYNDGKIPDPVPIDGNGIPEKVCDKTDASSGSYGGLTQLGSGADDGIYYHSDTSEGVLLNHTSQYDQGQFFFAALYGRTYDDFLGWYEASTSPYDNLFAVWRNTGGAFERIADLDPDLHCLPAGIRFIDMNADGLDDIVCIDGNGNAYLSINQGDGTDSTPPTFQRVSDTAKIMDNVGFKQDRIRMADIDGDGRGDYLAIDDGGNIQAWRNGWVDDIPAYWESLGQRFETKGKDNITGIRMLDLNGDGRADWLWVSDVGEVETWTGSRTCQSGVIGDGLKVDWRQGFHQGESSGYTHLGVAALTPPDDIRTRILFGRVWGVPSDFGNFGRKDYVYLEHTQINTTHLFQMHAWKSSGSGGTEVKADGDKYCNMLGHSNGAEDYVWTGPTGKMMLYPNAGKTNVSAGESFWGPVETMFDPQVVMGRDLDRRDLHLMDWDGDGDCDIVWTDPDNDNRPSVWLNLHHTTGSWSSPDTWDYFPNAASSASGVSCSEKRGFNLHDKAVQFADIDGNGRDDYLCIRPDGQISGFLHRDDNSWEDVGQIKFAEDKDRADLRFADVTGDGLDDMLWVDKFGGDGYVWYNRGPGDRAALGGSYVRWEKHADAIYDGDRAGTCVYFPDLDGNGHADLHVIRDVYSNMAATWFTPSCVLVDHTGDGGSCCGDPELPVQPGTTPIGPNA